MASEEAPPEGTQESPAPGPPRWHEPRALLIAGIMCFLALLILTWSNALRRAQPDAQQLTLTARLNTYLVEALYYWQLRGDIPTALTGSLHLGELAQRTAKEWAKVAQSTDTAARVRGRWLVNAAALSATAGDLATAHATLMRAASIDPARAEVYRTLAALYVPQARPVTLTPPSVQTMLDTVSSGPLVRARAATLRGDQAGVLAALQPGVAAVTRFLVALGIILLLVWALFIAWVVAMTLSYRKAKAALDTVDLLPAPAVPWGVGTALMLISGVFLLTGGVVSVLLGVWHITDASTRIALTIIVESASAVFFLALLLAFQGYSPWNWRVLGWRPVPHGVRNGVLALLLVLPVVWLASLIANLLAGTRGGIHPIIQELIVSPGVWLRVLALIATVVMAPAVEETLFRGLLFRALGTEMRFWPAAVTSGLLFALVHAQVASLLPITLLGIAFAVLTWRTRSVWPSAAAHAAFNGLSMTFALLLSWALQGPGA